MGHAVSRAPAGFFGTEGVASPVALMKKILLQNACNRRGPGGIGGTGTAC
jgi:hypothetical protein